MDYIQVKWIHSHPDEPILLFSEVDENGWETRKLEIFADNRVGFADATEATTLTNTKLSREPLPSLTAISSDPQFQPVEITKDEFERLWILRRSPLSSELHAGV